MLALKNHIWSSPSQDSGLAGVFRKGLEPQAQIFLGQERFSEFFTHLVQGSRSMEDVD